MASLVPLSDIKALEHPTLKVPYELLNKKFRMAQRVLDKEVLQAQNQVKELEKVMQTDSNTGSSANSTSNDAMVTDNKVTVQQISNILNGVVEKLSQLKRKAKECASDELEAANCCKRRLEHLKEHAINQDQSSLSIEEKSPSGSKEKSEWHRKRLDRMLVEHLLRCGYYDTAIKLAQKSNVDHLTNIDLFLVSKQVEESLMNKETSICLSWCQDNRSKLRRIKSSLEFNVRQQEFIELVRADKRVEAIKHARKHFNTLEEDQHANLQQVMGLLAFRPDTPVEPYRSLFDPKRWLKLVQQFREDNFRLFNLSATSVFAITLQCGLSALKTSHCYRKRRDERNPDCPVCSDLLNQLARPLPVAHCANSKLVCQLSGQPLNEHNQPLVLPNGHVYGEIALKQMAFENDGQVTCVRTKKTYEYSQLEKVFVMY